MSSITLLLSPVWLSWKNGFVRGGASWQRRVLLVFLAAGFWLGTYLVIRRVLRYFETVFDLGPGLAYQLLLIILLTFLSMLLFSNLIASLSTFFLARDLDLLHASPLAPGSFFYARLIQTTINSSWMVLFFSLPIFAAYGSVFGGGTRLYLWIALILPLFLVIPAAVSIVITHLLVYCLPAKRIRDILFFIGLFAFIVMYFLFRMSQPERLVQPESFGNFMQFLRAMETPSSPFLPSSWLAEILAGTLFERDTEQCFFFGLLASYALFLPLATSWVCGAVYFDGWSKAQESRQGRRKLVWFDRFLDRATRLFPAPTRAIMIKDIKTFLRDTTQWSQLFLLLALIVVYLYNFKVLPLDRSPMPAGTLRTLVSFANLALAGFVLSAVAVRFAFPAVSLEGKAFWILQSAPISLRALLWSKFWMIFVPLFTLGELLVFLSNLLLQVPNWMMALSLITVCFMTFGIAAIGVGFGALYPNFNYENAAEIPTSFGGAVSMIVSVAFIALIVMIEAWPIYQIATALLRRGPMGAPSLWIIAPSLAIVAALTAAVVAVSLRAGIRRLEQ
jgi:ABC-2 type transport system permease protein